MTEVVFPAYSKTWLVCSDHDNMPRSRPWGPLGYAGAVVDNNLLIRPDLASDNVFPPLPDLKAQVDRWTNYDEKNIQGLSEEELGDGKNNTIFVVSFGLWDIWHCSEQKMEAAKSHVVSSVSEIYDQLTVLANRWNSTDLKIVLPTAVDLTFLPGFTRPAEALRNTVSLVELWNEQLEVQAETWEDGVIYSYDTNAFMLDQIRDRQLFTNGLGTERPVWDNVQSACMGYGYHETDGGENRWSKPDTYLFW